MKEEINKRKDTIKKKKLDKSFILVIITSAISLISALIFTLYTIFFCKDITNNLNLIINSFIIFLFVSVLSVSAIIQKNKIKNILLSVSLLLICTFTAFNVLSLANIIKVPTQETLKSFVNKNITELLSYGEKNNIIINQTYEFSDTILEYNIISQDVLPNTLLKDVKELNVVVSSGPNYDKTFILQNFVGLNIDDALKIINEHFMNNIEVDFELNDKIKKDIIISQNISGEVKRNDLLKLVVSLGLEEELVPVKMEDLKGKSLFEATLWLKRHGFKYEITYEFSDSVNRNYCIGQNEKEGTLVDPKKDVITIIMSKGKEIVIPDFTSMSVNEATNWITQNNLKLTFKEQYDNELEKGKIILSNFAVNSKVEEGTTIILTISKGRLVMEKFDSIGEFRSWASSLGLEYEENSEFNDSSFGTIISITPNVGEYINLNSKIQVVYSKGKSTTIPNFYNKNKNEASSLCNKYNLTCYYGYRYSNNISEGNVISQSMSEGSTVAEGTSITIYLSKGPQPIVEEPPQNTCTSTETHNLIIQPNWVTGGSASTTISTLKDKLSSQYPNITFEFVTKPGNNPSGYIHDDSPITSGDTIQDCNTYTIIINE